MTIKEYITDKFSSLGIQLSSADIFELCLWLDSSQEVTTDNLPAAKLNICKFIPSLLARPTSISEGGMSMSWDKGAIKDYYTVLCAELGVRNKTEPTVKFISLR